MDKLLTNEEKEAEQALKEKAIAADSKWKYELTGYMQRQPRLDIKKQVGNYNYEQFREYTALYERAKKRDTEEQRQFYKMVKYSKANPENASAISFARKFNLDLIEIP
jgi:hypothetical protein